VGREAAMKVGELVTPTGRLVLGPDDLKSEAWLAARRWRPHTIGPWSLGLCIGSSDVPSILDVEHVDTPAHVFRDKVYAIEAEPNEAMNKGNVSEPYIAMEWCRRNRAVIDEIGLVAKDGEPWHQSTIDRRVRECPVVPGAECGLEVKRMEAASAEKWKPGDHPPDRILSQMLHQIYVTGYDHMHYMVDVPGGFRQGIVWREREQRLIAYVIGEVEKFRYEHLLPGIEPAWNLDKADKLLTLDKATHPERIGIVELDVEGAGTVMAYAQAQAEESAAAKRKKRLSAELRLLAGGAEVGTFSGERAYWYREGSKPRVNLELLRERWPDAYDAVVSESTFPVLYIDKAYKVKGDNA
jgi:predicted phage-related endonuclease